MRRSSPLWYLLGGYPVHQGNLNLGLLISLSSGSRTSVFTMVGVTKKDPEELDSLVLRISLMYSSRLVGEAFSGKAPVTYLGCLKTFLVCVFLEVLSTSYHRSTLSPHYFMPFFAGF